jgi:hypothetical protein
MLMLWPMQHSTEWADEWGKLHIACGLRHTSLPKHNNDNNDIV